MKGPARWIPVGVLLAVWLAAPALASAQGTLYEVVWPRGKKIVEITPVAKRLDTLQGKTICELWDWMFRGEEIFPVLERELAKRYPGIKIINYRVFGSTHGKDEAETIAALPSKLKEQGCDAVVSGVGC
jgi:hypothetical protein